MKIDKRILVSAAMAAMLSGTLCAQTQYDAARLIDTDLNGTARFVGMGGAMGALGGDISTMSTNPAGIGVFRRNDVSFTFGLNDTQAESTMRSLSASDNRTRMSFDQAGVVFSTKIGNQTPLRYVNYGVNYHKKRNFNKVMTMYGDLGGFSQTDQIAWMANNSRYGGPVSLDHYNKIYTDLGENYYGNKWSDVSWLSVLGIQGGLIGPEETTDETSNPILDSDGKQVLDSDGNLLYYSGYYLGMPGYEGQYKSRETGGVNAIDFNISGNVNEQFYFGATFGFYDVNYKRTSEYIEFGELYGADTDYILRNSFDTEGTGFDLKLGVIVRPIESSPFRIGLAVHTPTFYKLTDRHWASLDALVGGQNYIGETDIAHLDYELVTPWKFNFSLGHTIDNVLALGAEYEFTDYSSAKLRYDDGYKMYEENSWISDDLKGVHTLRLGMEARLMPEFSIRAGYNYSSAAFEKTAYKWLYPNSTRTDTEYENSLAKNIFTVGLGYRIDQFYLDAAYQYTHQKGEFYLFDNENVPATEVKNERNQFMVTLGYRF